MAELFIKQLIGTLHQHGFGYLIRNKQKNCDSQFGPAENKTPKTNEGTLMNSQNECKSLIVIAATKEQIRRRLEILFEHVFQL